MQCAVTGARPKLRAVNCAPACAPLCQQARWGSERREIFKSKSPEHMFPDWMVSQDCLKRGSGRHPSRVMAVLRGADVHGTAAAGCVQHCRVEACRSIAGLHPSCSLRLRPHPRRGLAKWAAAATRRTLQRPQACCCCCRLHPRLLHHAAAASLRCCTLLHARERSPALQHRQVLGHCSQCQTPQRQESVAATTRGQALLLSFSFLENYSDCSTQALSENLYTLSKTKLVAPIIHVNGSSRDNYQTFVFTHSNSTVSQQLLLIVATSPFGETHTTHATNRKKYNNQTTKQMQQKCIKN